MPISDQYYMQRALDLAQNGLGTVSPNPLVGCVIVHDQKIIGEGWHKKYGEAHAEVNAIESVLNKELLSEATAYVTLEPCSHFGKTPPCADLLIKHRLKKVVICNEDPFPKVNGSGIARLKAAGIDVSIGLLKERGLALNARFFKVQQSKKPYVILKWAETADGFIAHQDGTPAKISGEISQMYSHKWRTEEDAIMVGSQTAKQDNPKLSSRYWLGKSPTRILLDLNQSVPLDAHLLDQSVLTYNLTKKAMVDKPNLNNIPLSEDPISMDEILYKLAEKGIQSILVEGGPRLHQLFIDSQNFDEVRIFKSKRIVLKEGLPSANLPKYLSSEIKLENADDFMYISFNKFQPF